MDLQVKVIFKSPPVLFLGLDRVKVRQVDNIWPHCRHRSATDTTMEVNKSTTSLYVIIEQQSTFSGFTFALCVYKGSSENFRQLCKPEM